MCARTSTRASGARARTSTRTARAVVRAAPPVKGPVRVPMKSAPHSPVSPQAPIHMRLLSLHRRFPRRLRRRVVGRGGSGRKSEVRIENASVWRQPRAETFGRFGPFASTKIQNNTRFSHMRSVNRNFRGAQSDSQNILRGTAIRTVTIFSLSYRKF